LQSRFFPGNAGFQPASEFVGILPAQGGDFIPQPFFLGTQASSLPVSS